MTRRSDNAPAGRGGWRDTFKEVPLNTPTRFTASVLSIALLATGCGVSMYLWRFLPTLRTVDKVLTVGCRALPMLLANTCMV